MRVLLVDDYELVRRLLGAMLERLNHVVLTAASASEALRICREQSPEVIFTDYGLPGINGIELAKRLKELNPAAPVILITGWTLDLPQAQLSSHGVDFLLHKPFRCQDVETLLLECTKRATGGSL